MPRTIEISVSPDVAFDEQKLARAVCRKLRLSEEELSGFNVLRRSIDARKKPVAFFLRLQIFISEPVSKPEYPNQVYKHASDKPVIIIGMGPAGLFAALKALECGLKPIIYERGKPVRERRRDLAKITRDHIVNQNSNYCFGEGGAGTYSDGKLYTRSKKRGDIMEVLHVLVQHGADPDILIDTHPHIGTNKLPEIIENMRKTILDHGGEIHFDAQVTDISIKNNQVKGVEINKDKMVDADRVILATGHSARDIFDILIKKQITIEAKPFALGVRIEHPQEIIDGIQYKCEVRDEYLPPASYSIVQQVHKRGMYSFCMCPGGIIAPCATRQEEVVTNGWSPSKRDNPYANSGIVVEITLNDMDIKQYGPLAGVHFQSMVEQKAWKIAGSTQKVPAQRLMDFINAKTSNNLPKTSYLPGVSSYNLHDLLPDFVTQTLVGGFKQIGKRMKPYLTNEAVLHAVESRTSSPVRIPRDKTSLQHPEVTGLYPCGEGAGYAGGIVSAAVDGIRCINAITQTI